MQEDSWGVHLDTLDAKLAETTAAGSEVRAIVVINPGNPTGQSLPQAAVEALMGWAAKNKLVVLADEVSRKESKESKEPKEPKES